MMKTKMLKTLLWTVFFLSPALSHAQVFQWTNNSGVIHFTDNLHSVPAPLRASPLLIIREDIDIRGVHSPEAVWSPDVPEVVSFPEPEAPKVAPPVIHYSPQDIIIVVVNTVVQHPRKHPCPGPARCQPQLFRPNFEDRRYIHPSVFNGGSRQFVQPELFPPARR